MNKCALLVQILSCRGVKSGENKNQIIRLTARFFKRKKLVKINLLIWNKQSIEFFKSLKKFDYTIIEGKLHRNNKLTKNIAQYQQKDLIFSVSRIFKYKSILKNKDVDLFIK